jgi:hypothetical protein
MVMTSSIFRSPVVALLVSASLWARPCRGDADLIIAIKEQRNNWRSAIESLEYAGDIKGRVAETPEGIQRTSRRRFAAKAGMRFKESQHLNMGMEWEDDLDWSRLWARPNELVILSVINRTSEISREFTTVESNPKLREVFHDFYLRCIAWSPEMRPPHSTDPASSFESIAIDRGDDVVIQQTEQAVGPCRCIVVRATRGTSTTTEWLDIERSYTLVKRLITDSKTGIHSLTDNSDFREAARGVWLPWQVEHLVTRKSSAGDKKGSESDTLTKAKLVLSMLEINQDNADIFVPRLPAGVIKYSFDKGDIETTPGGLEMIDDIVRVSRKEIHQTATARAPQVGWPSQWMPHAACLFIGLMWGGAKGARTRSFIAE